MNPELTPEENQVVNLLLFGCESERIVAHILATSEADIEDRLLSIRAKWQVISFEEIVKKAEKNGYGFYQPPSKHP